jgi:methionyl-tRNA synthetase
MNNFYITTTLPYVNADPHMGHALEFVQADALARYFRSKLGKENVFFNVGTDEHGQKMYTKALLRVLHLKSS